MRSISLAALAAPALVQAGLRFGCSTLTTQRIDPVVEPGAAPAAHLHHIVGGGHFNMTMEGDVGAKDSCTTCVMSEDLSNYWTAVLFFKARNGSYHQVPVVNNAALDRGTVGGMTIYYTPFDFTTDGLKTQGRIKSFPPGFRMTVGSPTTNTLDQAQKHIGLRYNCLQTLINRGRELPDLPAVPCPAGIFAIHHFPACWDGKNLDSPNHQDHMYNTKIRDGFTNAPACPPSHPVRMPQLTYETVWDTTKFNDKSLWPEDGSQPFVWSYTTSGTEKTNGYGTHADYMFGWQGDSLQRAMDQNDCFYDGCGSLKKQSMTEANKCKVRDMVGEKIDGWLDNMPGQK